ncbi:hypothetical protein BDW02DRAFT_564798 [Decorospora gaudefroyi]|uniref:Uncharacterized protein n=1 Tax=Decorospora gaudefroyi TaxID=184978 RepID=A0A6A5KRD0_9PLEO|nr:hypothetical protein BDW02DRAFT_564798 [Decorospora gaudefroyi]
MSTTKKRKADAEVEVVASKKAMTSNTSKQEEIALYQVSAKCHPKFENFPIGLKNLLQHQCQTALYTHMANLQSGAIPEYKETFSVMVGTRTRSETIGFHSTVNVAGILDVSIANIMLLDLVAACYDKNQEMNKKGFVKLETETGLLNSKFIELHCVRQRELSWGLDDEGCLSMYTAGVQEKKLKERVWYVIKRDRIKHQGEV